MKVNIGMVADLARIGFDEWSIERLIRDARKLKRLYERNCNGDGWSGHGWDEEDDSAYARRRARIVKRVQGILDATSDVVQRWYVPYEQTDPRGAPLYIVDTRKLGKFDLRVSYKSAGVAVY